MPIHVDVIGAAPLDPDAEQTMVPMREACAWPPTYPWLATSGTPSEQTIDTGGDDPPFLELTVRSS